MLRRKIKQGRKWETVGGGGVVREGLSEEVTSEQTRRKPCGCLAKGVPGRGNSKCKGPEVGTVLSHSEEASVAGAEYVQGKMGGSEYRDVTGAESGKALRVTVRKLGFILREVEVVLALTLLLK